jgi:xylan 1,4-beta-xylosidase
VAGGVPAETIPIPVDAAPAKPDHDDFDAPALGPDWSTLRRPATPDWVDLTTRPSYLRIHGGQSPVGRQRPSLVARRVTSKQCALETVLEFTPRNFRQLAGITGYYNTQNWHFAYLTADDDGHTRLRVLSCDAGQRIEHPSADVDVTGMARIGLRVTFDGPVLRFAYAPDGAGGWRDLPVSLDATILSDEHASRLQPGEPEAWGFTGAFVGLWVQDLGADGGYADFDSATYTVP